MQQTKKFKMADAISPYLAVSCGLVLVQVICWYLLATKLLLPATTKTSSAHLPWFLSLLTKASQFRTCIRNYIKSTHNYGIWYIYIYLCVCLLLLCSVMMCANNRVHYDPMAVFVCLHITLPHYHHYANLSEGIELLKCLSGTFCLELCLRLSQLSSMQYMGLCVFSLPISHMMIVIIRVLYLITKINSEVWPICHCLWLGHETMVYALYIFYILIYVIPETAVYLAVELMTWMSNYTYMKQCMYSETCL